MRKLKNTYLALALLSFGSLCCTSCQDTLEEDPDSYYTRKDFFVNTANAEMAINGIYNALIDLYGYIDGQNSAASDDIMFPAGGNLSLIHISEPTRP